ncbi:MAG: hypothetical protein PUJ55_00085 [Clostridiales bacterium]|nr:hypothetical protein [Roseburia sp.]MDD7635315.1 hypothetical protein [Clostridiales bacterium]MDY4113983.1 hypothetical protein [Roseburia sp.]
MNLNVKIQDIEKKVNIPIEEDEYQGKKSTYMVFSYDDERPILNADNEPYADMADITFQLIMPKNADYMNLKHQIRDELENSGFSVTAIRTLLGSAMNGTDKIRRIIFETNYTEER